MSLPQTISTNNFSNAIYGTQSNITSLQENIKDMKEGNSRNNKYKLTHKNVKYGIIRCRL